MQVSTIGISDDEFKTRKDILIGYLEEKDYSGVVIFDSHYIQYYAGFAFIPTERPIALLMNVDGDNLLFVPRLEFEHAQSNANINNVSHYEEYPDQTHPMEILREVMVSMGLTKKVAVDQDGYPCIFGYQGPTLTDILGYKPFVVSDFIENQMMLKSQVEVALIKESVKWGHYAHVLLQRYTRVGLTETEVSRKASDQATKVMLDTIGPLYRAQSVFSTGPNAGYRGQIGRNSAIPHALSNNITFQPGDVLVTGAGAPVWGYHSELERTMIVGSATAEQRYMFDHMLALQETAFAKMKPGVLCADVDRAVRAYYDKNNLFQYWKHHVGHAIGLRYHEGPFLDIGDNNILQEGMVFTVEPGLYVPELGGFRHSDTVLVTDLGIEILTYYPRDLDSLTIPI